MSDRKKILEERVEPSPGEIKQRMRDAIVSVLVSSRREYFDQLSDDELFGYATVLWDYHTDMRDEFARRELMKACHTWAAQLGPSS